MDNTLQVRLEQLFDLSGKGIRPGQGTELIVYNGKGKKDRVAFISDDAKAALCRYLKQRSSSRVKKIFLVEKGIYKGKPISVHGIKKRMEYYAKKSGVKASCHHLRHTMATQMLNADANLATIQSLLGHSRITTTERYGKIHNAKARRDYFKAMRFVTEKSRLSSEFQTGYRNFFNKKRREQVSRNFGMMDIDA